MSIAGVTLDYGPFGFMDRFDPEFICNASDNRDGYQFSVSCFRRFILLSLLFSCIIFCAIDHFWTDFMQRDTMLKPYHLQNRKKGAIYLLQSAAYRKMEPHEMGWNDGAFGTATGSARMYSRKSEIIHIFKIMKFFQFLYCWIFLSLLKQKATMKRIWQLLSVVLDQKWVFSRN